MAAGTRRDQQLLQGGELDGRHDVGHPAASHDQPGARISEVAMEVSSERFR